MIRRRKYNEKDVVINFSVLSCFLVRGGGEPFLAVPATYDEADTEAHAMELTNLYPPPCISLTEILLGAGFAVSVLVNVGLGWKLWTGKKQEVKNEMSKIDRDIERYCETVTEPPEMQMLRVTEIPTLRLTRMPKLEVTKLPILFMPLGYTKPVVRRDMEEPVINPEINVDMAVLRESNEEAGRRVISEFERLANLITSLKDNLNNALILRERSEEENQYLWGRIVKLKHWIDFFRVYMEQRVIGKEFKDKAIFQQLADKGIEEYQTEDALALDDVFDSIGI